MDSYQEIEYTIAIVNHKLYELQTMVQNIKQEQIGNEQDYLFPCQNPMEELLYQGNTYWMEIFEQWKQDMPIELAVIKRKLDQLHPFHPLAIETLKQIIQELDKQMRICRLVWIFIEIKRFEKQELYTDTVHSRFVDTIFNAIEKNRRNKNTFLLVMEEVETFLNQLSLQEKGNLVIEHNAIYYHRNQSLFLKFLEIGEKKQESISLFTAIFAYVLSFLGEKLKQDVNQNKWLECIYATDFYRKIDTEKQWTKKDK